MYDEKSWEERYAAQELWSGRPNAQLVAEVADLTPGTALDGGCGEGADAIWLAERGWQVTGADFATTGLKRAAKHAEAAGVQVDWVHADLTSRIWEERFDLVSTHFLQMPPAMRTAAFARLAAAVAPGGTLLVVGHDGAGMEEHHAHSADKFFGAEEVVTGLGDGWDVRVAESRPRRAIGPDGREWDLRDVVVRAIRKIPANRE